MRLLFLPVHLLGRASLAALLCCISPVAGDVKLQDDGVVDYIVVNPNPPIRPVDSGQWRSQWPLSTT